MIRCRLQKKPNIVKNIILVITIEIRCFELKMRQNSFLDGLQFRPHCRRSQVSYNVPADQKSGWQRNTFPILLPFLAPLVAHFLPTANPYNLTLTFYPNHLHLRLLVVAGLYYLWPAIILLS